MPATPEPAALRGIPLFAGCNEAQLATISQRVRTHTYPAGSYIIAADTPGDAVFVILSGTVKVQVTQADGKEVIIAVIGPGAVVGEMSVLDSQGRSADVVTQEDSTLLIIDRASFNEMLDHIPPVARALLTILTARLRMATEQIQALCTLDVLGMVARQLLAFADLYGEKTPAGIQIPLRLTQTDIAGMTGASRERVNAAFSSLRQTGLVSVSPDHRITILNAARMRDIVQQQ